MTALPAGLTHPYDDRTSGPCNSSTREPKATAYAHGHTFTWTHGDSYVAIQHGRVANAVRRLLVVRDPHPHVPLLTGRQPVTDWLPAPAVSDWHRPGVMEQVADLWFEVQRAKLRRTP